jgi:hypothetical protein
VSGWALDTIEAAKVDIWRERVGSEPVSPNGLVYVGDAVFVEGARPDVDGTYPGMPFSYRAGWGYLLLTTGLPNSSGAPGNGLYKLHAIAHNTAGLSTDLGTKTISVDNAHANKPFGSIDTPGQGETISGNAYVNFGWALTQNPYCIATDASTITTTVDGQTLGHPVYDQSRSDVALAFPGLCNSQGAVGYFRIDTTKLANGVHTIGWVVYDNQGRGDGIGSRFINVFNTGTGSVPDANEAIEPSNSVKLKKGFGTTDSLTARAGNYTAEVEELDRVELAVGAAEGHLLVNGRELPLPPGSSMRGGTFYWQLAPGLLGDYRLQFKRPDEKPVLVMIRVHPKTFDYTPLAAMSMVNRSPSCMPRRPPPKSPECCK